MDLAVGSAVFFLDSDEVITSELQASILKVVETGEQGGRVRRRHIYLGRRMRYGFGAGWQTRLVKKGAGRWAGGSVHETLHVHGDVVDLDGPLMHEPYRDLDDHLARVDTYAALFAKDAHFGGRRARWFDLLVRPPLFFLKTYILRLGLLEGLAGLSLGAVGARYTWLKWHKLHRLSVQPTGRL